jgi:5-formyltetrahydrofolate cyclo-ligase
LPSAALAVPQILIVPLLAFDGAGRRLGFGAGYYDRTLLKLRASGPTLALGFAFAAQRVAEVPAGASDQRLDWIVTEEGAEAIR